MKSNSSCKCHDCAVHAKPGAVCDHLSDAQLGALNGQSRPVTLKRGDDVGSEEMLVWPILMVVSGAMSMQHLLEDGRKTIAALYMQGDIIDMRGASRRDRGHLIALGKTKICRMAPAAFEEALNENQDARKVAWNNLRDQTFRAIEHSADLAKKQALEKLASFIFECRRRQRRDRADVRVHLPLRRIDLADYLGMQPETVSRSFRDLEERGVVAFQGKLNLEILDFPTLRRIANGDRNTENLRRTEDNRLGTRQSG